MADARKTAPIGCQGIIAAMKPRFRKSTIAALDIGSSKVCCFIAKVDDAGRARVLGIGHQISTGMKAGVVMNVEAVENSILNAVHAAEQMAGGDTIRSVYVNVSCGQPASQHFDVELLLHGQQVRDLDVQKLLGQCRVAYDQQMNQSTGANDNSMNRHLLHAIPVGYSLDGSRGIRDPRGMYGQKLGASVHLVSAQNGALRNLANCVEHCHLDMDGFVLSPYASGLATLVEDEMDLGCTLIDMGGGTTSVAVFFDGNLLFSDIVPIGGMHVTNDIARGLSTPVLQAERLKTLYGGALATAQDDEDMIDVPLVGESDLDDTPNHIPKSYLNRIIQPRLEETFEAVRAKLTEAGVDKVAGRRVVLTGGASQLSNVRELAAGILDKQVRLGKPIRLTGLADAAGGPAFSTCAGLLTFAMSQEAPIEGKKSSTGKGQSLWHQVKSWIEETL